MSIVLAILCAWVLGGIPFGLVLVRLLRGVDIRTLGSGNVGATNASRAFGKARVPFFLLFYVLDFLKGYAPARWFAAWFGLDAGAGPGLAVALGAAAVLGHCFSPFLRLRGGKGVATTTGVFAVVEPLALGVALLAFFAVLAVTRRVFFGSLAIAVALPLSAIVREPGAAFGARWPVTVLALAVGAFLFWTHRSNFARLRSERAARRTA
ncbi:MAG: glycerol-3-phosphate acyltransferase [Planctomycetes bacterium]|nr:glycerol-3-phosphate acyltransferase [Planctomycetota bacterium]